MEPWMDLHDVEGGGSFSDAIVAAIDACEALIFLVSQNSLVSEWVKKEVLYAKDCGKRIIPVILDGTSPGGWFRFEFGRIDCIDWGREEQQEKLFADLSKVAEKNSDRDEGAEEQEQRRQATMRFLEQAGKLISNDGVIDDAEHRELQRLALEVGLDDKDRQRLIGQVEAEQTLYSRAKRYKFNDGVINASERRDLVETAERLGINPIRAESLIERAECTYEETKRNSQKSSGAIPSGIRVTERGDERYLVLAGTEVTRRDIEEAVELDCLSYPECYRGNVDDCVQWASANPDIYVMLRDLSTGRIVAYINAMPVTDECYVMIRRGDFIDVSISPEMILSYDMPLPYSLYFSSVVIHPEYRNSGVFKYLFDAIVDRFLELGTHEIFIRRMLADAVSVEGEKFCKLFGMVKLDGSKHGSALYEVSMIPPRFRVTSKKTKQLHDYYKAKYEEAPYLFEEE